jgi:drug/metabolite transporter (DMT)-like permease
VALLLWYELTNLSGRPLGVLCALVAAAVWALGTQMLRKTTIRGRHADAVVLDDGDDGRHADRAGRRV